MALLLVGESTCLAAEGPTPVEFPRIKYHSTAHSWSPLNIPREKYLDVIERAGRFSVKHQDADGAVVDPLLHRELQYSTQGSPLRSSFGDIVAVRVQPKGATDRTFVYPHNSGQPSADAAQKSFRRATDGFDSEAGSVHGNLFVGKTIAGGIARSATLPGKTGACFISARDAVFSC